MFDLNKMPEAVHLLIQDEVVIVDGKEFIVDESSVVNDGIYLTLNTQKRLQYLAFDTEKKREVLYSDYCIHVRDSSESQFAIFDRKSLETHIKSNTYTIS